MQRDEDEDAVWRSIVDNYGDRPAIEAEAATAAEPVPDVSLTDPTLADPAPADPTLADPTLADPTLAGDSDWFAAPLVGPEERFVPPPPPPLPKPTRDRFVAWLGVFGSPAVLLVCLIAGIGLPRVLAYGLVAAFVGGFLYLVWQMPRGPRDPWDDGAQV